MTTALGHTRECVGRLVGAALARAVARTFATGLGCTMAFTACNAGGGGGHEAASSDGAMTGTGGAAGGMVGGGATSSLPNGLSGNGGTPRANADAGIAPAAHPDAGSAAFAARCSPAGGAVCEDFETESENGPPDPAKWTVITSYSGMPSSQNEITIDGTRAARGKRSLHVHTETSDPVYIETKRLPLQGNAFYGRVFAYFAADPGARSRGHWGAFVGVGKRPSVMQDVEVRLGGQFDILVANYSPNDALQTSASRDGFYDDGARLPVAKWTCFEFLFDGGGNELRLWMDGTELDRLHVTDWGQFGHTPTPAWSPTYDRLRIGYQSWNADTPIDVFYDAIAIDTQRIGCAP
jgi:hypothetical protein